MICRVAVEHGVSLSAAQALVSKYTVQTMLVEDQSRYWYAFKLPCCSVNQMSAFQEYSLRIRTP